MKLLLSFVLSVCGVLACQIQAQQNGQLVIFIQEGRSISQDFKRNTLPEIKKLSKQKNLDLKIVDASKGAPEEVVFTPAIFYRNGSHSTLYNGRYSEMDELEAFISTAGKKTASPKIKPLQQLTWDIGRATLNTTMKINPLSGKPPKRRKFNAQKFESAAYAAVLKGMEFFRASPASANAGWAKSYHMEFFPTIKEGVLLVQMELYSEYDLNTPVFKTEIPSGNEWKKWEVAFEKAGNRLEKALIAQISNWDNGDGFDTLRETTPVNSWSEVLAYQPSNGSGYLQMEKVGKE